jgi:hypothetical protein
MLSVSALFGWRGAARLNATALVGVICDVTYSRHVDA